MATPTHTPKGRGYDTSLNYFGHANWMWNQEEWQGSQVFASHRPPCDPPNCFKDFWDTDKWETTAEHYKRLERCEGNGEILLVSCISLSFGLNAIITWHTSSCNLDWLSLIVL